MIAARTCRSCAESFTPTHGRSLWCPKPECQLSKLVYQSDRKRVSARQRPVPARASPAAREVAVVLPETPDALGLQKLEPVTRYEPEVKALTNLARGVVEPGRPGVRRAVVALAHAEGRDQTRDAALAAAAELVAWAERLRWTPPAQRA